MLESAPNLLRQLASIVMLRELPRPDPRRLLVVLTMPIGDTLMCQPALSALRRRFPMARITALVWPTNAPVIDANPDIDDYQVYDHTSGDDFITRFHRTMERVYAERFDMVVSFSPSGNCCSIVSGIPRQAWLRLPYCFWIWGDRLDPGYRQRHVVELYWGVVRQLGLTPRDANDLIPHWQVKPDERCAARERLLALGITPGDVRPLIMIHPGAAGYGGRKRWPVESFGALARWLIEQRGAQVIVLGGPDDVSLAKVIAHATDGQAVVLAGKTNLRESIALITQADGYVGCDSGLTHFAVAMDVPCVGIYGYSNLAQFAPRADDPHRLRVVLPMTPRPPAGFFIGTESPFFHPRHVPDDRMSSISVKRVIDALDQLLSERIIAL